MKTPYRAKKELGMWWLYDRKGMCVALAFTIADLWRQAAFCLEPVPFPVATLRAI